MKIKKIIFLFVTFFMGILSVNAIVYPSDGIYDEKGENIKKTPSNDKRNNVLDKTDLYYDVTSITIDNSYLTLEGWAFIHKNNNYGSNKLSESTLKIGIALKKSDDTDSKIYWAESASSYNNGNAFTRLMCYATEYDNDTNKCLGFDNEYSYRCEKDGNGGNCRFKNVNFKVKIPLSDAEKYQKSKLQIVARTSMCNRIYSGPTKKNDIYTDSATNICKNKTLNKSKNYYFVRGLYLYSGNVKYNKSTIKETKNSKQIVYQADDFSVTINDPADKFHVTASSSIKRKMVNGLPADLGGEFQTKEYDIYNSKEIAKLNVKKLKPMTNNSGVNTYIENIRYYHIEKKPDAWIVAAHGYVTGSTTIEIKRTTTLPPTITTCVPKNKRNTSKSCENFTITSTCTQTLTKTEEYDKDYYKSDQGCNKAQYVMYKDFIFTQNIGIDVSYSETEIISNSKIDDRKFTVSAVYTNDISIDPASKPNIQYYITYETKNSKGKCKINYVKIEKQDSAIKPNATFTDEANKSIKDESPKTKTKWNDSNNKKKINTDNEPSVFIGNVSSNDLRNYKYNFNLRTAYTKENTVSYSAKDGYQNKGYYYYVPKNYESNFPIDIDFSNLSRIRDSKIGPYQYKCSLKVKKNVTPEPEPDEPTSEPINYVYRVIDLSDPFPNERIPYNWQNYLNSQGIDEKELGEQLFENRYDDDNKKLDYKITLDKKTILEIREFNKSQLSNSKTYLSNTGSLFIQSFMEGKVEKR